jgi:RNA polymerase sigma-70 factor (ECF subfamily)
LHTTNEISLKASEEPQAAGLQRSDADYFESLVRDYGPRMLSVARRYLNNEADAQDCVQDAYLQAFEKINQFENRSSISTWLHRIVVNTALMKLRSKKRRPEELIEDNSTLFDSYGRRVETEAEMTLSVEDVLVNEQARLSVRHFIEQLPDTARSLILLRDIDGYSVEESAKLLTLTSSNVRTGLHRARKRLKMLIQNSVDTDLDLPQKRQSRLKMKTGGHK